MLKTRFPIDKVLPFESKFSLSEISIFEFVGDFFNMVFQIFL